MRTFVLVAFLSCALGRKYTRYEVNDILQKLNSNQYVPGIEIKAPAFLKQASVDEVERLEQQYGYSGSSCNNWGSCYYKSYPESCTFSNYNCPVPSAPLPSYNGHFYTCKYPTEMLNPLATTPSPQPTPTLNYFCFYPSCDCSCTSDFKSRAAKYNLGHNYPYGDTWNPSMDRSLDTYTITNCCDPMAHSRCPKESCDCVNYKVQSRSCACEPNPHSSYPYTIPGGAYPPQGCTSQSSTGPKPHCYTHYTNPQQVPAYQQARTAPGCSAAYPVSAGYGRQPYGGYLVHA